MKKNKISFLAVTGIAFALSIFSISPRGQGVPGHSTHNVTAPVSGAATIPSGTVSRSASEKTRAQILAAYGKLPVSFEANRGQTDGQVKFLSRGRGYNLFLTPSETILALIKPAANSDSADPLSYSTYLGGSNRKWGFAIAVDADGNAYVTGFTNSADFPNTPGRFPGGPQQL
ncbi:MAG TPA: SBBP repeat-containing protein [Candidatus Dormibacteraeota bacterium]|nr:SBBP repeat-containing protein [Candidatus Dormibacteraeota bacterium]